MPNLLKLINWLLPNSLSKPLMQKWLEKLSNGFVRLNSSLADFKSAKADFLKTTAQIAVLRGALNRKFDATLSRIEVEDLSDDAQTFMFTEAENLPLYLPQYLQEGDNYDYVVRVPSALIGLAKQIATFCQIHKLPSKRVRIDFV